jgi:hypothetical protein
VQAQIGHATIATWETTSPKCWSGGTPTPRSTRRCRGRSNAWQSTGKDYIERWKARIRAYPDGLARAMVEKRLQIFPVWYVQDALDARDATLWHFQIRIETAYALIGILAGLNRLYFTTFQFKKMSRFFDQMRIKPERLAERVEALFGQTPAEAAASLEVLVREVLALVEREMPDVDVARLQRRVGGRRPRWEYADRA